MSPWKRFLALAALAHIPLAPAHAAGGYPDRPITLVVGYAPGGGADITARLLGQRLSEQLGVSVVVENRPGAGQNIGAAYVARSAPDGYTILVSSSAMGINPSLFPRLEYDPVKSFAPVAVFGQSPNLLVASSTVGVGSVQELVAYGRKFPGRLNFSSSGHGSTQHLSGELFKQITGIEAVHVPYKGSGPSVNGVLAGEVQFTFVNIPSIATVLGSDKIKVLAVTSEQRLRSLPDVPTMAEAGIDGMVVSAWYGLMAPAGTPESVVATLNQAANDAVRDEAFKAQLVQAGVEPMTSTPAFFAEFLQQEIDRWKSVIRAAGAKVD